MVCPMVRTTKKTTKKKTQKSSVKVSKVKAKKAFHRYKQAIDYLFKKTDYDLTIVSHTEPMDIGIYARDTYYFNYNNPEFKKVITTLDATVDTQERYKLLAQAQEILSDDCVNGFMFQLAKHGVWNKDVMGLWENSPVQANDLTGVYWAK